MARRVEAHRCEIAAAHGALLSTVGGGPTCRGLACLGRAAGALLGCGAVANRAAYARTGSAACGRARCRRPAFVAITARSGSARSHGDGASLAGAALFSL